jgi:hypothetical protein
MIKSNQNVLIISMRLNFQSSHGTPGNPAPVELYPAERMSGQKEGVKSKLG